MTGTQKNIKYTNRHFAAGGDFFMQKRRGYDWKLR